MNSEISASQEIFMPVTMSNRCLAMFLRNFHFGVMGAGAGLRSCRQRVSLPFRWRHALPLAPARPSALGLFCFSL